MPVMTISWTLGRLGRHGVQLGLGRVQGAGKTMIPHFPSHHHYYLHPDHICL
jgi:hypothetical protein